RKAGMDVAQLQKTSTAKGEYLAADVIRKGLVGSEVIAQDLPKEINALYWAKNMYWRSEKPERFVRPVRWIVALLGNEVLALEYAGVRAGNRSRGHRILADAEVTIPSPSFYCAQLETSKVIVDPAERERRIRKALDAATRTIPGARWRDDPELLATVVNLTEF